MPKTLYLLDGMALVYRAHFAFIQRPILTAKGVNTSALYGFTQTLLDIRENRQPTHLGVAFDTATPTERHRLFPAYKAQREEMPEELSQALPQVRRMLQAFQVPVLIRDGFEADDLIGTLVGWAEAEGFESYMVTPDKDFGQLVTARTWLYRPGRLGADAEILGPEQIAARWGIREPRQLIDVLGLMGDASDNIPGVPGIGEKTASRLVAQYGSLEAVLEHVGELKGKLQARVAQHQDQARLSKRLATIQRDVPLEVTLDQLAVRPFDADAVRQLLVEFEFNAVGRRLFGEDFKAGRGYSAPATTAGPAVTPIPTARASTGTPVVPTLTEAADTSSNPPASAVVHLPLATLDEVPHRYREAKSAGERASLLRRLAEKPTVGFATSWVGPDPRRGRLTGLAFALGDREGAFVPIPSGREDARAVVEEFRRVLEAAEMGKTGYDLKSDLAVLRRHDLKLGGPLWDVGLAHALAEPELRHSLEYIAESQLGYTPMKLDAAGVVQGELGLEDIQAGVAGEATVERADLALQLRQVLEAQLQARGQGRVFHEVEMPLVPVLAEMEREGIRVDTAALGEFSALLGQEMAGHEHAIQQLAGEEFNVNSPKQLGEVLFDKLRLLDRARRTRTGQYATDEQTLMALATDHEIVRRLLEYRTCSKLKSTYADALPAAVDPVTGRIHTTFHQLLTSTGRLSSQDPNLQNIPIRTDRGQEIRRAFVPRAEGWALLSADYSQIELRIIAALGQEAGLLEAFHARADVHTATAARVFGVQPESVTPEMRKKAKMVNYGIAYGLSAFGLGQRLAIPRKEAAEIIEHYFAQFPGLRGYMERTTALCRERGYVETITGRRRYLRDITSANATVRGAAERNAINMPIQGTAADLIKVAMARVYQELERRNLQTRLLLQVHDELVLDLWLPEEPEVTLLVRDKMQTALGLDVPIEVELGVGRNWLEAH